ncbi:murein hydrolase activator EnvC family protein [Roseospirillum parvum]|uniref:Septal ring factor EnvC, activator of murein hydrolases AmiA and AmiB n=1 Tax=Roseospirillum parvum TaxID=83401 RepID=A0A1G7TSV0_9PROT|nr:peptidoglycan DD-metalloendopeptidase family protein [Roseospirillum parvum]SDG37660.1 Septal ring factor EnvC, activator of murein hydrolases AmiA and AmiB [Roseospirillum parvum]
MTGRAPSGGGRALFALPLAALLLAAPLAAQEAPPVDTIEPPDQALESLERSIAEEKARQAEAEKRARALKAEIDAVRRELVAAADRVQDREAALTYMENELSRLTREARQMSDTLDRRQAQRAQVLAALERLALRPGSALLVQPGDPADAVRSALLLRAAVPAIEASARELAGEIARLAEVRAALRQQRDRVASASDALAAEHQRLNHLFARKRELLAKAEETSAEVEAHLAQLANEAADLHDLIDKLNAERLALAARALAPRPTPPPAPEPAPVETAAASPKNPPTSPRADQLAALSGLSPGEAKGRMPLPATGRVIRRYGATDPDGGPASKGLTLATRPGAQVIAPFDGVVAYAGPFRGYGRIVIIDHGDSYHTLLAGLGRIDIAVGQRLLAGEPVGATPAEEDSNLYLELRRQGQPINPLPWMMARDG